MDYHITPSAAFERFSQDFASLVRVEMKLDCKQAVEVSLKKYVAQSKARDFSKALSPAGRSLLKSFHEVDPKKIGRASFDKGTRKITRSILQFLLLPGPVQRLAFQETANWRSPCQARQWLCRWGVRFGKYPSWSRPN